MEAKGAPDSTESSAADSSPNTRATEDSRPPWQRIGLDASQLRAYGPLGAVFVLLVLHVMFVFAQVVGDAGVFMTVGAGWLEGHLPYVRYIDHKPPGIYAVLAAAFAIERSVFSAKVLVLVVNLATAGVVYWLGRRLLGRAGAVTAVLLFLTGSLVYSGVRVYTEPFVALAGVLAMVGFIAGERSGLHRYYTAAGLLAGIAILFKQPGGTLLIGLVAYLVLTSRRRDPSKVALRVFLMGAAAAVPFLLAGVYFWSSGALSEFLYWTVLVHFVGESYGGGPLVVLGGNLREVLNFPLIWVLTLSGLAVIARERRSEELNLLAVLTVASCLPLLIYGWGHYYLQPLPFVALAAGFGYERLAPALKPALSGFGPRVALVLVVTFLLLPSVQVVGTAAVTEVATNNVFDDVENGAYINARTDPGDPILVVGEHAKLYFLAEREPMNRHLYYLSIDEDLTESEVLQTLQREQVEYVAVNRPCDAYLPTVCDYVSSNYELVRVDGSLHIYKRSD